MKFLAGSDEQRRTGIYGKRRVATAKNMPGAFIDALSWQVCLSIYVLGGDGFAEQRRSADSLRDLWRFDELTKRWTFLGCANCKGLRWRGTYKRDAGSSAPWPSARSASGVWTLSSGRVVIFGGAISTGRYGPNSIAEPLNDMWWLE